MATNVIVISDDVKKSQTISDFVGRALTDGGFTDVSCMHPAPFQTPWDGKVHRSRSALEVIQDTYPDFLKEPIAIRAIPVMGVDPNYGDTNVDTNPEKQLAFAVVDSYSVDKDETDIVVLFKTEGKPPAATSSKVPGMEQVVMEAINEQLGEPAMRLDLADTARRMEREGKLNNGYAVAETLDEIEKERTFANAVEAIADQSGYGSPGISEETLALIRGDALERADKAVAKSRLKVVKTESEEQP